MKVKNSKKSLSVFQVGVLTIMAIAALILANAIAGTAGAIIVLVGIAIASMLA